MIDAYIRTMAFVSRVTGIIAALMIGLAVVVICDLVVERYVLNFTTIWQIDVVTYAIVAATFVGSAYVLTTRGHVNVDLLPVHLGAGARYWLAIFTSILGFGFVIVLFVLTGAYWYESWVENWHSDTVWRAPLWVPYFSMPVGLGLLTLQYIADFLALVTGREPPFGISPRQDAEDVARAQAREALETAL